jgi:thioredoxin 1
MSSLEEFKKLLNSTDKPVFVKFGAEWCVPCRLLAPVFAKASKTSTSAVYVTVDVDEAEDISIEYKVSRIPVVKVFVKGQEKEELGGSSDAALLKFIAKYDPPQK